VARGGVRPGAGRPKGAATVKTREIANAAIESGLTPLDYLLSILRDANAEQNVRIDAAKAAAPYVHPRLSTVDVGNKDDKAFEQVIRWAQTDSEATPDPSRS
jgi:hypothetical protein